MWWMLDTWRWRMMTDDDRWSSREGVEPVQESIEESKNCTAKVFVSLQISSSSWKKKSQTCGCRFISCCGVAKCYQLSDFQFILRCGNILRFATVSEIMCVTRPHTICWCCAHHCSIPVKNVIYSYLFITEKLRWGAWSRLRGLPLPSGTQWNRPKQKILVVNRLEAADCEEWFSLCVCLCVCPFESMKAWKWK